MRDAEEPLDARLRGVIATLSPVNCSLVLIVALAILIVGCSPPGRRELLAGKRLVEQGRPQEAVEPLKRAMSLFGTNTPAAAHAWNWLGLAYHHAGQANDALQAYQNAIKCDFNLFAARYISAASCSNTQILPVQ
ncbi:MAG: tetratricopeptide repeat protein [Verrucomicrobiia bacterium]